jgi:hypothetical protein
MLERSALTGDTMVLTENGWITASALYHKHPNGPRVVTAKFTKAGNYHRSLESLTSASKLETKTIRLYHARSKRPVVGSDLNPAVYGLSAYRLLPFDMGSELDKALQTGGYKAVTLDAPRTYYAFEVPSNVLIVAQKTKPTYKKIVIDFDDDNDEDEGATALVVTDETFSPDAIEDAAPVVNGHDGESYILEGPNGVIKNVDASDLCGIQEDSDYAMDFIATLSDDRASMAGSMTEASLIHEIEDRPFEREEKELGDEKINGQDYLYAHIKCK